MSKLTTVGVWRPLALLAIVLLAILSTPASAATILDETMTDYEDTAGNGTVMPPPLWTTIHGYSFSGIGFADIENIGNVNYVVFDVPGASGIAPGYVDGVYDIEYTLPGKSVASGRVYVDRSRNALNQVVNTRMSFFFDDWDVSGLTGNIAAATNFTFFPTYSSIARAPVIDGDPQVHISGKGWNTAPRNLGYTYVISSGNAWTNRLVISEGEADMLTSTLYRSGHTSTFDVYRAGALAYTNWGAADDAVMVPPPIDNVTITSITGKQFVFAPDLTPPPTAPVTISIRSAQTGDLLPNARITILDGQTGDIAVNQTLSTGSDTFDLEAASSLRYLASATASSYTPISPIQFGVGSGGISVTLWMSPDAAPDVPVEEGKSTLYGYILTQGNQQPISGATVALDGYGSTTTSSTGFYIFNNVTPSTLTLSASATLHDALSESVTVDATATQHNLALTGHYLLTVIVKDGDTLANVQNATISLSDGQESTQNPVTFNGDYGPYSITAAAGGYYPVTQSTYLDHPGTTTATVLLTARSPDPTPAEMPNYPQHNVRFLCVDEYNHPLQNVTITAVYQESSGPVSWITDWLGLSQNVHVANSTLQGTTGLDGSVIFLMVQSVQYRMTVAAPAPLNMTKTFDLYPKEDQITIRFVTSPGPDLSTMPAYDLTATETDPSSVRLALTYNDTTNATTHLSFQVYDHATGEIIYSQTFAASSFPGTVSPTYDVSNTKGAMYRFGFEATNTHHGTISQYKGITLKGDNLLVDLGFEDRTLYNWLAVILLFLFAGAFSGTNVKQGAILVPLFGGGLFWLIGWLPITIGGAISAIGFLGVLLYMRKSEWKVRA